MISALGLGQGRNMIKPPVRVGRYANDGSGPEGPVRLWNADGSVIANFPHTLDGWMDAIAIMNLINAVAPLTKKGDSE